MPDDKPLPTGEFLLYQTEDERSRIECRLQDETLWLSLNQISELFDRDKSLISKHLKNIFEEGELVRDSVVAQNATTAADGKAYRMTVANYPAVARSLKPQTNRRRDRFTARFSVFPHPIITNTFPRSPTLQWGKGIARSIRTSLAAPAR